MSICIRCAQPAIRLRQLQCQCCSSSQVEIRIRHISTDHIISQAQSGYSLPALLSSIKMMDQNDVDLVLTGPVGNRLCVELLREDVQDDWPFDAERLRKITVTQAIRVSSDRFTSEKGLLDSLSSVDVETLRPVAELLMEHIGNGWQKPWSASRQLRLSEATDASPRVGFLAPLRTIPGKPEGAVWTSSAWNCDQFTDWHLVLDSGLVGDLSSSVWSELRFDDSPNVFEINRPDDWTTLVEHYPDEGNGHVLPDWKRVAEDYDGVHLSAFGLLTVEGKTLETNTGPTALLDWNAESCMWLRNCWTAVIPAAASTAEQKPGA